ncbi:hypothetical protein [uncultured Phenylobacterium sp.]|uniref:hypothetical protein n=1 Tax=uncultured Phenylobacterium sp. TaxID=349273 RepID=UPI0025CF58E5|nr:hypothetical protein [uncultured Phenylobacterium sp.]
MPVVTLALAPEEEALAADEVEVSTSAEVEGGTAGVAGVAGVADETPGVAGIAGVAGVAGVACGGDAPGNWPAAPEAGVWASAGTVARASAAAAA